MAASSGKLRPRTIEEYDAMVAKINALHLPNDKYEAMVDAINKRHLTNEEHDTIWKKKMARKGIIPTIPVIPFNLSIALPDTQSNFDKLISQRSPNNTKKYIAKGAFGVIYQDPSHPGRVIKILRPGTNIDVLRFKANKIADITGDERQRLEVIQITKNDVPSNALKEYAEFNAMQHFMKKNRPIPALSMPYLGVNLITYLDNRPFTLPEELYLDQCHKLLQQTYKLYRSRYSHGDLHSENIVFDGTEMTMIDFDIFGTFEEVARKYESDINISKPPYTDVIRSWNPPEFLILYNTLPKLRNESDTEKSRIAIANDYISKLYKRSLAYFSSSGITLDNLRTLIKETNEENLKHMTKHNISMIDVIPYLDNFGLGMALLEVFDTLYPETTNEKLIKTRELLEKITQFKISERITPDVAFAEMDKIHPMSRGRRRFIGKTRLTYKNRPQGGAKRSIRRNKNTRRLHK